jgi:hypothetical protein
VSFRELVCRRNFAFYMVMNKLFSILLITLGSLLPVIAAENSSQPSKAEVEAFRLSMDKVNATTRVFENLFELIASDPKLAKQWQENEDKADEEDSGSNLSAMVQRMGRTDKRILAIFTKAGISPKEADMTMATLAGGMLGLTMAEGAGVKDLKLEKGMAKDNIEFIRAHKAEILQAFDKIKALEAKYANVGDDGKSDDK